LAIIGECGYMMESLPHAEMVDDPYEPANPLCSRVSSYAIRLSRELQRDTITAQLFSGAAIYFAAKQLPGRKIEQLICCQLAKVVCKLFKAGERIGKQNV
jgi:hypothetical protein